MKQKLLLISVALLFCLPFLRAQSGTAGPLAWSFSPSDSVLTISGTGAMPDYRYSTAPWHSFYLKIKTIVIEPGAESIGAYAFYNIFHLSSVTIPTTVTTIGNHALSSNVRLLSITIPPSITLIGDSAFYHCLNLEAISIPAETALGERTFANCPALQSITVDPANPFYSSFEGALYNKAQTLLVSYPAGKDGETPVFAPTVTDIGTGAFHSCARLKTITFPSSVVAIEARALELCNNVATINLPASNLVIAEGFIGEHCNAIKTITVASGSPVYVVEDGVLFNKDRTLLLAYPPMKEDVSYTVPPTVERIGDYAFAGGSFLTADVIVDNPLKNFYVGEPVTAIGKGAFAYRQTLDTFSIAASVERLDDQALYAIKAKYMALHWSHPATVSYGRGVFDQSTVEALHVPAATEPLYRSTPPWSQIPIIIADIMSKTERTAVTPSFKAVSYGGQISVSGLPWRETVRIYNLSGRLVYARSADGPSMLIPVSSLPSGVYILQAGRDAVKLMVRH